MELSGYYFDIGPDQADNYKKTIKKIEIVAGMKYSADVSCLIETLDENPPMMKMPTKMTLESEKVMINLQLFQTSTMISTRNRSRHTQGSWISLRKIVCKHTLW